MRDSSTAGGPQNENRKTLSSPISWRLGGAVVFSRSLRAGGGANVSRKRKLRYVRSPVTRPAVLTMMLGAALLGAGCGRRAPVFPPPPASIPSPGPASDEVLFKQGLAAFHQGTPESYTRAADAFRAALRFK